MQKSGFPKMRHYVGFSQIGSHLLIASGPDTHTNTHTHTDFRTGSMLGNQAHACRRPACAWFKKTGPAKTGAAGPIPPALNCPILT